MGESLLESDTFVDYVECIQNAYDVPDSSSEARPGIGVSEEMGSIRDIWRIFAKLVTGQRGPFAREGVHAKQKELPDRRFDLRPLGPPKNGDLWHCTHGRDKKRLHTGTDRFVRPYNPPPLRRVDGMALY